MTDPARVAALEASGRAALPALHEERVGDWVVRVSGGDTKRVNSVNPVVAGARPETVIEAAEALYRDRGLLCRFRLTPLAYPEADATLAARGYELVDPSLTMTAALVSNEFHSTVTLSPGPTPSWLARIEPLSGRSPAAAAVQAQLLAGIPGPLALAKIEEGVAPLAAGYASIGASHDGSRAQLSDIVVAPHARGRGLGRRLVAGLLGWAYEQGCREAMLQVLAGNYVARGLYRSLGFVDAYPYHYRVRR